MWFFLGFHSVGGGFRRFDYASEHRGSRPTPICRAACVHDSRGEMPRADEPTRKPGGKPAIVTTVKSDEDEL